MNCSPLASYFVMPSIFESYGIAVAEAMSYGKAIVATDVGGLPEVVQDGGLLCRPNNPKDLAMKLSTLLLDENQRTECAKRSMILSQSYTWDSRSPKVEKEYLDAMAY